MTAPDLPARFDGDADLAPRADLIGVRLRATGDVVSDAHGRIAESRLDEASVTRVELTGATLVDVAITGVRAAELVCRDGAWLDPRQAELHAVAFAEALGIGVTG